MKLINIKKLLTSQSLKNCQSEKMENFCKWKFEHPKSCFYNLLKHLKKHTLGRKFGSQILNPKYSRISQYFGHFNAFLVKFWSRPSPLIYFSPSLTKYFDNIFFAIIFIWSNLFKNHINFSKKWNPDFFNFLDFYILLFGQTKSQKHLKSAGVQIRETSKNGV